jgi:hypothetical protein
MRRVWEKAQWRPPGEARDPFQWWPNGDGRYPTDFLEAKAYTPYPSMCPRRARQLISTPIRKMMVVITVAWALILSESYLFFSLIRPTAPNIHESIVSEVLKIGSIAMLAVLWIVVLFALEYLLFGRNKG